VEKRFFLLKLQQFSYKWKVSVEKKKKKRKEKEKVGSTLTPQGEGSGVLAEKHGSFDSIYYCHSAKKKKKKKCLLKRGRERGRSHRAMESFPSCDGTFQRDNISMWELGST
jgi:hypothetical protein